ncbi:MAG: serine hydrolase [Planctomycetia bacterium]|nr:serine hydrolase [Planctomycetia bacterium]
MLPRSLIVALLWFACCPGLARAQAIDPKPIDALIQDALKYWEVPGCSVVIVRDGKVIYLQGFGVRRLGGMEAVTPDSIFPYSSCSKAFIALAIGMLVDEGKMRWDDPVRKHLPHFRLADPLADANCTLRDLLCHRTGVAGHDLLSYRAPWSCEDQVRRIGLVQPSKGFRAAFQYSSIMYLAAAQAVEKASGQSWNDFVEQRIFKPLDMKSATNTTTAILKPGVDRAEPHDRDAQGKLAPIPWYEFPESHPAVSVHGSARDLGKWLIFQLGDGRTPRGTRLVSAENLAETQAPQIPIRLEGSWRYMHPFTVQLSYGLGWVVQDYHGRALASHAGVIDGMRAHIALAPDDRLGLAILSNRHMTRLNLALSNQLLDHLLGLRYHAWNEHYRKMVDNDEANEKAALKERLEGRKLNTRPSRPLESYVGEYNDPAYGTVRISLESGQLVWQWSTFRANLLHFHFDTFTVQNDLLKQPLLGFTLNADGEPNGLKVLEVDFKKQPAAKK